MNNRERSICAGLAAAALATVPNAAQAEPSFQPLGHLNPGPFLESQATTLSSDGNIVIGRSTSPLSDNGPFESFRWSADTGMVGLGTLPGSIAFGGAFGVSADGSVIVGLEQSANVTLGAIGEAYRWTSDGGMVGLGSLAGGKFASIANATNGDGSVVVGRSNSSGIVPAGGEEAFRWTQSTGMVGLGAIAGDLASSIADISADGSILVGNSGTFAATWTESDGWTSLGTLPGAPFNFSDAKGISADNSTIVGTAFGPNGFEAFRWTEATGMVGLGDLDGGIFNSFSSGGISGDGSIIVGGGTSAVSGVEAFIWDELNGMRNLKTVLEDLGLADDLAGWQLEEARGISDDGTTIAGWGFNPQGSREAWIAQISSTNCNPADFAEPFGVLNFFDISEFLSLFSASDPAADMNNDGSFNFFDIRNL